MLSKRRGGSQKTFFDVSEAEVGEAGAATGLEKITVSTHRKVRLNRGVPLPLAETKSRDPFALVAMSGASTPPPASASARGFSTASPSTSAGSNAEDLVEALATQKAVIADLGEKLRALNARVDASEASAEASQRVLADVGAKLKEERQRNLDLRAGPPTSDASARDPSSPVAAVTAAEDYAGDDRHGAAASASPSRDVSDRSDGAVDDGLAGLSALREAAVSGGWLVRPDELDSMDDASNGDAKKHVLGEGSSGFTTRQKWRGSIVAVKRVNVSTPTRVATFLREVDVLRRLRHPHVLPFYGAGLDPVDRRGGCFILTRVCEGGTMKQWLYPQSSNGGPGNAGARTMNSGPSGKEQPPLSRRLALAWDVARGMAYLESRGVMHRDLKPGNVFVTDSGSSGRAVIADFGLAREVDPEAVLTGETGTYLYMAPEVIRHERTYGSPADAWSFGVTLGELVRGAPPYPTELFEKRLSPTQIAIGVADGLIKPALMNGGGCHPGVAAIAAACTEFDPGDRPTFRRVVQELDAMLPEVIREAEADEQGGGEGGGGIAGFFAGMFGGGER